MKGQGLTDPETGFQRSIRDQGCHSVIELLGPVLKRLRHILFVHA